MEIIDMSTKRKLKKMVSVLFILGCFFIGNTKCKGADLEYISQETANYAVQERGYDLPVDEVVKEEAIEDCKNVMNQMKAIYQKADKGTSSNVVVSETVMEEMQEVLKEKNVPVITSAPYSNMANYSKMEEFLFRAEQDLPGDIVLYRISWEHKNQFIPEIIRFGELKIYLQERIVKKNDSDVHLSKYEYDILLLLAKSPGRIFGKEMVYDLVWNEPYSVIIMWLCDISAISEKK